MIGRLFTHFYTTTPCSDPLIDDRGTDFSPLGQQNRHRTYMDFHHEKEISSKKKVAENADDRRFMKLITARTKFKPVKRNSIIPTHLYNYEQCKLRSIN